MAQRVNALSLRLGLNLFWSSQWYASKNYSNLFFEDTLIHFFFKNVFENRGFFFKRLIIKRNSNYTFLFLEVYGNPYFKYSIPKTYRKHKKFQRVISTMEIKTFLTKLIENKVRLSIFNMFMINRIHANYIKRLRGQFFFFKKYRFSMTILGIFSIVLRTKGAGFLARIFAFELEQLERKKKNKDVWRLVSFIRKLVQTFRNEKISIHGIRVQLKGRFKGIKRPKKMRFREGMVPFNTFRATIDYAYASAITINGSFGIKIWICYKG